MDNAFHYDERDDERRHRDGGEGVGPQAAHDVLGAPCGNLRGRDAHAHEHEPHEPPGLIAEEVHEQKPHGQKLHEGSHRGDGDAPSLTEPQPPRHDTGHQHEQARPYELPVADVHHAAGHRLPPPTDPPADPPPPLNPPPKKKPKSNIAEASSGLTMTLAPISFQLPNG